MNQATLNALPAVGGFTTGAFAAAQMSATVGIIIAALGVLPFIFRELRIFGVRALETHDRQRALESGDVEMYRASWDLPSRNRDVPP